ncbi:NAD-dependent dihydropyrimidine dehydrogenase subunit PreA [Asaia sp. HN010]|uniref:NAD-dependent dihydropyrimidine dehydrogenase subunit PreA n=1 Tax=Asaia sp. HN010 TaxID=3081233 RepID=UPI0030159788
MADLRTNFAGITSPNPFWLASAPPTDKEYNVRRAFEAGWGGVVWKTLGEDPPVVNLSSRYGALAFGGQRLMGLNNIELISDRPLATNIAEIKRVKRDFPDRALIVSLMVPCEEHRWKAILPLIEETGADGIELNFGCPHGMSERNMGSAVGQVPEYVEMVTRWCKQNTRMPVIVKLTPNVTNILMPARAARRGGADAVSLINTIQSVIGVDLDAMAPMPVVGGKGTHGGYCGPAIKPVALRMIGEIARDSEMVGTPISGMGGISNWHDAAEFLAMGSNALQVCTAAMHYGFRIVEDMIDGLSNWMDTKGYATLPDLSGRAVSRFVPWNQLNMNFRTLAHIDQKSCVGCGLCHIACEDTSHQAIAKQTGPKGRQYSVIDDECVGCNLCAHVCPVDNCITMVPQPVESEMTWLEHPANTHRLNA